MSEVITLPVGKKKFEGAIPLVDTYVEYSKPVPVTDIELQGDVILKRVLTDINRLDERKRIFTYWNNLREASEKYCHFLSYHFPGHSEENVPMVVQVIGAAFEAYYAACERKEPEGDRVAAYLWTLIDSADHIAKIVPYTVSETDVHPWGQWREPVGEWIKRVPGTQVHFGICPQNSLAAMNGNRVYMASKILNQTDLGNFFPTVNRVSRDGS